MKLEDYQLLTILRDRGIFDMWKADLVAKRKQRLHRELKYKFPCRNPDDWRLPLPLCYFGDFVDYEEHYHSVYKLGLFGGHILKTFHSTRYKRYGVGDDVFFNNAYRFSNVSPLPD